MTRKSVETVVAVLIIFFLAGLGFADQTILDETRIRQIVKEVIKENPKLIYDTLDIYIGKLRKRKTKNEIESSFRNRIKDLRVEAYNPVKGTKNAPITIIEFSDFQCRYCKTGHETINKLFQEYPGKLRLVFKNHPLPFHKHAMGAACAAMAANRQGKFWKYHDLLFKNFHNLNEKTLIKIARNVNLDLEKFNKDRHSSEIINEINSDLSEAERHKLNATPIFVINGVTVKGTRPLTYFKQIIDRLLKEKAD